jgi:hypothetical protein
MILISEQQILTKYSQLQRNAENVVRHHLMEISMNFHEGAQKPRH